MVGARVGGVVGNAVGEVVGPVVGDDVGVLVGPNVGDVVGPSVGECVGPRVGDDVGVLVGPTVGCMVGPRVGEVVGPAVGDVVGLGVIGETVGRTVDGASVAGIGAAPPSNPRHHSRDLWARLIPYGVSWPYWPRGINNLLPATESEVPSTSTSPDS